MIKKTIIPTIFFISTLFCSCGNDYILTNKQMEDLLLDIHLVDGISLSNSNFSSKNAKSDLYTTIYEKHNTTKEQFDSSMVYYSENLEELVEIYEAVQSRIEELEKDVKAGKYTAATSFISNNINTKIINADIDILPYIQNELWESNRQLYFTKEQLDTGLIVKLPVDTFTCDKIEMRFNIASKGILDASCEINIAYKDSTAEVKTINLPLNGENPFVYTHTTSAIPENIKLNFTVEKDTIEDVSMSLTNCRIYEISTEEHNINLFD